MSDQSAKRDTSDFALNVRSSAARRLCVGRVALLMIEAIDCYMGEPDEALRYRLKRANALWLSLRDIDAWLDEQPAGALDVELWESRESFCRIYAAFFVELDVMQSLVPGLACRHAAPKRLAPVSAVSNQVLMHQIEDLPVRWTLVQ